MALTVGELKKKLEDYGDHLPVILCIYRGDDEFVANEIDVMTTTINMETFVSVEGTWEDDD